MWGFFPWVKIVGTEEKRFPGAVTFQSGGERAQHARGGDHAIGREINKSRAPVIPCEVGIAPFRSDISFIGAVDVGPVPDLCDTIVEVAPLIERSRSRHDIGQAGVVVPGRGQLALRVIFKGQSRFVGEPIEKVSALGIRKEMIDIDVQVIVSRERLENGIGDDELGGDEAIVSVPRYKTPHDIFFPEDTSNFEAGRVAPRVRWPTPFWVRIFFARSMGCPRRVSISIVQGPPEIGIGRARPPERSSAFADQVRHGEIAVGYLQLDCLDQVLCSCVPSLKDFDGDRSTLELDRFSFDPNSLASEWIPPAANESPNS